MLRKKRGRRECLEGKEMGSKKLSMQSSHVQTGHVDVQDVAISSRERSRSLCSRATNHLLQQVSHFIFLQLVNSIVCVCVCVCEREMDSIGWKWIPLEIGVYDSSS